VASGGTSLPAAILDACQDHTEQLALLADDTGDRLTFARLAQQIDRVGAALTDRGLGRGDTVAIWSPNQPAWLSAALGAMAAGCTVTGISPLASDPEAEHQLRASAASMLVTVPPLAGRAATLSTGTGVDEVVVIGGNGSGATPFDELIASNGAPPDLSAIDEDDIALLPFSSGTTGLPKGVELSHRSLTTMLHQIAAAIPVGPGDAALALPPFPHVMGMVFTGLWPLSQGATIVTTPRFDPDRFVVMIAERRLTLLVVPPMLAGLLANHPAATPDALASVRLIGFGGAPTPPPRQQAVADRFPGIVVGQGYGMTELTCVAAVSRMDDPGPIGSVGRLVPNTELQVVDPVTGRSLPANTVGELWVRGPQVMVGYRDHADATTATIDSGGWLHTGDLGSVDPDGYVFVLDRIKDLIKVKGYQVAPAELEQILVAHPAVSDAGVSAVDVDGDQRPVAFVVPAPGSEIDTEDLQAWVAERVAPYKRLHAIHVTDALPRNASGKILRRALT
jgi:acyl-CoA synthetase (AMP-forming)/AMP-acid ligase II